MKTLRLTSPKATSQFGFRLAKTISKKSPRKVGARVLALVGDLGSGKTTFVQGFMKGLGLTARITSPTFLIIRRYPLKNLFYRNVFHVDLYRLKTLAELKNLSFEAILKDNQALVLVEWADKAKKIFKKADWISFSHESPRSRVIMLEE